MIACDVVMELFPEFFNVVYPRLIGWLKKHVELRMMFQPSLGEVGFMDDVIIGNEDNFSGTSVGALEMFQQTQKQIGIFA